jgi:hypothetical protein
MSEKTYDVYIVGLGGQGILTVGDLLAHAALMKGLKVNFYPTKGMSQRAFRTGPVAYRKTRRRRQPAASGSRSGSGDGTLGSLKGVRYAKAGTDFLLYDYIWPTTAVVMGKAHYPEMPEVTEAVKATERI